MSAVQQALSYDEIPSLEEDMSALADVLWKHASGMAQTVACDGASCGCVCRTKKRSAKATADRAARVSARFLACKADGYDRLMRVTAHLATLRGKP